MCVFVQMCEFLYVCVVSKAKCLINGFHLVQENSLLTPALSSLLRREKCVYVNVYEHACVCMEGRARGRGAKK